jgi:mersacidin/lichenicidin family type 2 lantibiotic
MANLDIIRAWKDPEYRLSLSKAEQALLLPHPAGLIELADAALAHV